MMKLKTLLFLLLSNFAFASFDFNENIKNSYIHIINLEFGEAHSLLDLETEINPNNGIIALNNNYKHPYPKYVFRYLLDT